MAIDRRRLDELKLQLIADERDYNEELKDLVTLTKSCVRWSDPLPSVRRRTIAATTLQVKLGSDNLLGELDPFWFGKLPLDGIFNTVSKHLENCSEYFTYCSQLQELRGVLQSGIRQRSDVSTLAFSAKFNLERCLLPIYRLREMRAQLQEVMLILATGSSRVELFHCGQSIDQLSQILTECYKVLTSVNGSDYIKALEDLLKSCRKATSEKNSADQYHSYKESSKDSKNEMSRNVENNLCSLNDLRESENLSEVKQTEKVKKKNDNYSNVVQEMLSLQSQRANGVVRKLPPGPSPKSLPKQKDICDCQGAIEIPVVQMETSRGYDSGMLPQSSTHLQKPCDESIMLMPKNSTHKFVLTNSIISEDQSGFVRKELSGNSIEEVCSLAAESPPRLPLSAETQNGNQTSALPTAVNNKWLLESCNGDSEKRYVINWQVPILPKKLPRSVPIEGQSAHSDYAVNSKERVPVEKHSMESSKHYYTKPEIDPDSKETFHATDQSFENSTEHSTILADVPVVEGKQRLGNISKFLVRVLPTEIPNAHSKDAVNVNSVGSDNKPKDLNGEALTREVKLCRAHSPGIEPCLPVMPKKSYKGSLSSVSTTNAQKVIMAKSGESDEFEIRTEPTLAEGHVNDSVVALMPKGRARLRTPQGSSSTGAPARVQYALPESSEDKTETTDEDLVHAKNGQPIMEPRKKTPPAPLVHRKQYKQTSMSVVTEAIDNKEQSRNHTVHSNSDGNVSPKIKFEALIKKSQEKLIQPPLLPKKLKKRGSTALLATHIEKMLQDSYMSNSTKLKGLPVHVNKDKERVRSYCGIFEQNLPEKMPQNFFSALPHTNSGNALSIDWEGVPQDMPIAKSMGSENDCSASKLERMGRSDETFVKTAPKKTLDLPSALHKTNKDSIFAPPKYQSQHENQRHKPVKHVNRNLLSSSAQDKLNVFRNDDEYTFSGQKKQLPLPPRLPLENSQYLINLVQSQRWPSENSSGNYGDSENSVENCKVERSNMLTQTHTLVSTKSSESSDESDETLDNTKGDILRNNFKVGSTQLSKKLTPPPLPPKKRKQFSKQILSAKPDIDIKHSPKKTNGSPIFTTTKTGDASSASCREVCPSSERGKISSQSGMRDISPTLRLFNSYMGGSCSTTQYQDWKTKPLLSENQTNSRNIKSQQNALIFEPKIYNSKTEIPKKRFVRRNSEYFNNIQKVTPWQRLRHTKSVCDVGQYLVIEDLPVEFNLHVMNESPKKVTHGSLLHCREELSICGEHEKNTLSGSNILENAYDDVDQFSKITKMVDETVELNNQTEDYDCNSTNCLQYENTISKTSTPLNRTYSSNFLQFSSIFSGYGSTEVLCSPFTSTESSAQNEFPKSGDDDTEDIYEDVELSDLSYRSKFGGLKSYENVTNQNTQDEEIYSSMEFSRSNFTTLEHGLCRKPSVIKNKRTKVLVRQSWKSAPLYQTYVFQSGNSKSTHRRTFTRTHSRDNSPYRYRQRANTVYECLHTNDKCTDMCIVHGVLEDLKDDKPEYREEEEEDEGIYADMGQRNVLRRFVYRTGVTDFSEDEEEYEEMCGSSDGSKCGADDENIYESIQNIFAVCNEEEKERKIKEQELNNCDGDTNTHVIVCKSSYKNMIGWCAIPEVVGSGVLDTLSSREKALYEAKYEVISSKVSYLKSLSILQNVFADSEELTGVLSEENRDVLFGFVGPMKRCSEHFLADLLSGWPHDLFLTDMLTVIEQYANSALDLYIDYCSHRIKMNDTLAHLKKTDKKFCRILSKLECDEVLEGHRLESFLILPVQRITRFPLLVGSILCRLSPEDEEYEQWKKTLETLQRVTVECNEAVRRAEQKRDELKDGKEPKNLNEKSCTLKNEPYQKRGGWFTFKPSKSPQ